MTPPFDGKFADTYVLPLAIAAYDALNKPSNVTQSWDIISNPGDSMLRAEGIAGDQPLLKQGTPASSAYRAMLMQPRTLTRGEHFPYAPESDSALTLSGGNLHFGWVSVDLPRKTLIISIRGTQYFSEWLKDFDFIPVPYLPLSGKGFVHQGFQIVYYSIREHLQSLVAEARRQYPTVDSILITGHSLGAAVVGVAAPDVLLSAAKGLSLTVYTLAEPRVGNPAYKHFFDQTVSLCWRINNIWDIVPHQPPFLFGYEHEGNEKDIDGGFSLDQAHNHGLLTGYKPALDRYALETVANTLDNSIEVIEPEVLVHAE